jgi:hypothetical protein
VVQGTFSLQQLADEVQIAAHAVRDWQLPLHRLVENSLIQLRYAARSTRSWTFAMGLFTLIAILHWLWAIALLIGALVAFGAYQFLEGQWTAATLRFQKRQFIRWLKQHRSLVLAIAAGGVTTVGTGLLMALWQAIDNPAMASWAIAQTSLMGAGLAWVLWQQSSTRQQISLRHQEAPLDQLLDQLQHPKALYRLRAVRRITHWVLRQTEPGYTELPSLKSHVVDCFRLMLQQEADPMVRKALHDHWHILASRPQLTEGNPAWEIAKPLNIQEPMENVAIAVSDSFAVGEAKRS